MGGDIGTRGYIHTIRGDWVKESEWTKDDCDHHCEWYLGNDGGYRCGTCGSKKVNSPKLNGTTFVKRK